MGARLRPLPHQHRLAYGMPVARLWGIDCYAGTDYHLRDHSRSRAYTC